MSTGHGAVAVLCDWEGNRRFGVILAIRYRLCRTSTCGLNGLRKTDAYARVKVRSTAMRSNSSVLS